MASTHERRRRALCARPRRTRRAAPTWTYRTRERWERALRARRRRARRAAPTWASCGRPPSSRGSKRRSDGLSTACRSVLVLVLGLALASRRIHAVFGACATATAMWLGTSVAGVACATAMWLGASVASGACATATAMWLGTSVVRAARAATVGAWRARCSSSGSMAIESTVMSVATDRQSDATSGGERPMRRASAERARPACRRRSRAHSRAASRIAKTGGAADTTRVAARADRTSSRNHAAVPPLHREAAAHACCGRRVCRNRSGDGAARATRLDPHEMRPIRTVIVTCSAEGIAYVLRLGRIARMPRIRTARGACSDHDGPRTLRHRVRGRGASLLRGDTEASRARDAPSVRRTGRRARPVCRRRSRGLPRAASRHREDPR